MRGDADKHLYQEIRELLKKFINRALLIRKCEIMRKELKFLIAVFALLFLSSQAFAVVDVVSKSNELDFSGRINPSVGYVFGDVVAGRENTMKMDKEGLHVTEVTFISKADVREVAVNVEEITESELDVEEVNSPVFAYLKVTKSWQLADADVKLVRIRFKVLKSWLEENHIGKEDIYLAVYNGNMWEKAVSTSFEGISSVTGNAVRVESNSFGKASAWIRFPIKWLAGRIRGYVVYSPSDYEYYTAKIDRFGYVAIVGKAAVVEGEAVIPVDAVEKQSEELAQIEEIPVQEKPSPLRTQWLSYAAILIFLAAVIGASIYKRMKHKY